MVLFGVGEGFVQQKHINKKVLLRDRYRQTISAAIPGGRGYPLVLSRARGYFGPNREEGTTGPVGGGGPPSPSIVGNVRHYGKPPPPMSRQTGVKTLPFPEPEGAGGGSQIYFQQRTDFVFL